MLWSGGSKHCSWAATDKEEASPAILAAALPSLPWLHQGKLPNAVWAHSLDEDSPFSFGGHYREGWVD